MIQWSASFAMIGSHRCLSEWIEEKEWKREMRRMDAMCKKWGVIENKENRLQHRKSV